MEKNPFKKKIRKTRHEKQAFLSIISSEKENVGFGQGGSTAGQK